MRWRVVFLGFAVLLLAVSPAGDASADGAAMLRAATSLATDLSFAVPCEYGIVGRGGECFTTFYPLISILAAPVVGVGHVVADWTSAPADYVGNAFAQLIPGLCAAGVATFATYFANILGASHRRALLAGLTTVFATELAVYYRTFFAESLAALLVCVIVWGFLQDRRWRAILPPAIAALILAKPQLVLVGLCLGALFAVTTRSRRPAIEAVVGTMLGAALYAAYNLLRFSDATNLGGEGRTLQSSAYGPEELWHSATLLLVTPSRGFLIFSPIAALGLYAAWRRRSEPLAMAAFAIFVALLLPALGNPGSGFNWGDRYLTPCLALFVALAWACPSPAGRRLAPLLAVVGMLIVLPTFVGTFERYFMEFSVRGETTSDIRWSMAQSPIVGVWGATRRQIHDAQRTDVRALAMEPDAVGVTASTVDGQRFFKVVNQWWWMTPALGVPRALGLGLTLVMIALGSWLLLLAAGARRSGTALQAAVLRRRPVALRSRLDPSQGASDGPMGARTPSMAHPKGSAEERSSLSRRGA